LDFFRKLEARRSLLIAAAIDKGCNLSFATTRNTAFFALEYLEQRYLRNLLHELNQVLQLQSVILVHDGFYFSPKTSVENVQLAANLASRATGLPPFELKCRNLSAEWHRNFSILERMQTINHSAAKKRKSEGNQVRSSSNSDPQAQVSFCSIKRKLTKTTAHFHSQPTSKKPKNSLSYASKGNRVELFRATDQPTIQQYFSKKRTFELTDK
jgi:hypothetical protein